MKPRFRDIQASLETLGQRFQAMKMQRIKVPNQGRTHHCGVYVCYFIHSITNFLGSKQDATLKDIITLMEGMKADETKQQIQQFRKRVWGYYEKRQTK